MSAAERLFEMSHAKYVSTRLPYPIITPYPAKDTFHLPRNRVLSSASLTCYFKKPGINADMSSSPCALSGCCYRLFLECNKAVNIQSVDVTFTTEWREV